jgi:hypothetical protein
MNYILIAIDKAPKYLNDCIQNIKAIDQESKIYLCTNKDIKFDGVKIVNFEKIISNNTKETLNKDIYKNTFFEKNPLWFTSLLRIFLLRDLVGELNIKNNIHFDNDVLIYKRFKDIEHLLSSQKFNITKINNDTLVFGYSYFYNFKVIDLVCEKISEFLNNNIHTSNWKENPFNEMKILGNVYKNEPDLFNILPSYSDEESNYIFDGATYGQIIGGTHSKPRRILPLRFYKVGNQDTRKSNLPRGGWLDTSHYFTEKFLDDKSKVILKNGYPILITNNKEFEIINLHIHSKELKKYKL